MKRVLSIVLSFSMAACASVQEYPRCYLFRAPDQEDIKSSNAEVEKLLRNVIHVDEFSLGKDAVGVRASRQKQQELSKIWPEYGCVNLRKPPPAVGEIIDKWVVARCHELIQETLSERNKAAPVQPTKIAEKYKEFTCH